MSSTDWIAFGSIATAATVLVALIVHWLQLRESRRQREEDTAAQLREGVRTFAVSARSLVRILLDRSPIILATDEMVRVLPSMLGSPARPDGPDDLFQLLSDSRRTLQAAVRGWYSSRAAAILQSALTELAHASERLSGELNMLSAAGSLARRITEDAYRLSVFARLLTDVGSSASLRHQAANDDLPPERLLPQLSDRLERAASLRFEGEYEACLRHLDDLIELGELALLDIDGRDLVRAARGGSTAETYTDEMREDVERLSPLLGHEVAVRLAVLVDEIEGLCQPPETLGHARRTVLRAEATAAGDAGQRAA